MNKEYLTKKLELKMCLTLILMYFILFYPDFKTVLPLKSVILIDIYINLPILSVFSIIFVTILEIFHNIC